MQAAAMPASDPRPQISGFPLAPGVRLGKFEILHELASGGMGKIYVAQDTLTKNVCALKVLIPAFDAEPARLDRFKRESLIGLRLNHRNIIRIHDIGEDAGFYFISMELLDGEDLRTLLDREPHPDLTRIAGLCLQMLDGLEFAHEQAVVHRDFKPQNIFLTTAGVVKLLDFGVAQALRIGSNTTAGCMIGTPGYMSPEQATGKSALDGRSDIYSWGVVLYEMLTGRLPFRGDNPLGVAAAHVYETPPPIHTLKPDLAPGLAALVMRCLEKNPSARFGDVAELRTAFTSALDEAGAAVGAVTAAIHNARTPTPKSAVGVTLGQNAIITKIIPKRLREAMESRIATPSKPATVSMKRLVALLGIAGSAVVVARFWPGTYRCDGVQRIDAGDHRAVQASIVGSGFFRMARACSLEHEAAVALVNSQIATASARVREALDLEADLVWATVLSGDLAAQSGDVDGARRAYETATTAKVGTDPERALAWARLARLALDRDDLDAASHYLDEASRTGVFIGEVPHLLAQLDMRRGDYKQARDHLERLRAAVPGDIATEQAIAALDRQVRLQDDADFRKQLDDAIDAIKKQAPRPPRDPSAPRPRSFWVLPAVRGGAFDRASGFDIALEFAIHDKLLAQPGTKVVERQLIGKILDELKLGASPLTDLANRVEIGHLSSARFILRTVLNNLEGGMVAHWEVVDVEKGELVDSGSEPVTAATKPADVAAVIVGALERAST